MQAAISSRDVVAGLRHWTIDEALPFWATRGFDFRRGGFHERMLFDGTPDLDADKRLRVQARQIYVFSHAAALGWFPDGTAIALRAFDYMIDRAQAPDGLPGFVQLLDDRTLLIPDRPGNNRIDGMKNLLVNPKVGIIFMVPGSNETYRVTGSATLSTDPELLKRFEVSGKPPRVVMVVAVEEAFNHCPKALVRAKLWEGRERPSGAPTHGDFAAARDGKDADYARDYNEKYAKRLKTELY